MKNLIFMLALALALPVNAKENSIQSASTIACGHALYAAGIALNNLSQTDYCTLYGIMNNNSLNDEQKWATISATSSLSTYASVVNSSCSTLQAENIAGMSSSDLDLVGDEIYADMGIANAGGGCSGYKTGVASCLRQDAVCVILAFASGATGCLPCVALGLTACSALMIDCGINVANAYPGCGGSGGSINFNPVIRPFDTPSAKSGCQ